jgi:hypothetical protein
MQAICLSRAGQRAAVGYFWNFDRCSCLFICEGHGEAKTYYSVAMHNV